MNHLPRIAIVGGGLEAWMAAAALANAFKGQGNITVLERGQPSSTGMAEAAIPTIRIFNEKLGIDENDFIRATRATFSLGTEFRDWREPASSFFHPFGQYGISIGNVGFHHCWLRLRHLGDETALSEYSLAAVAAALGKFQRPVQDPNSVLSSFSYGFHLDPELYAIFLRDYALNRAVVAEKCRLRNVALRADDGVIDALIFEDGARLEADLYLDCTGEVGILIEQALHTGYEDWSGWLPCDRMITGECVNGGAIPPFTRITAHDFGWRLRVPLQGRTNDTFVYSSNFIDTDAVRVIFPENSPASLREFTNGRRRKFWNGNCVALGAAAGFLEPLEGTDIHLMQSGIARLLQLLPGGVSSPAIADEYNRLTSADYQQIRDFLILHYANQRSDSSFWQHFRAIDYPESLAFKIGLFKSRGRVTAYGGEVFFLPSWLSLFSGLGISPQRYHPFADGIDLETLRSRTRDIRTVIRQAAEAMPPHSSYLAQIVGAA
jgi:tryptophan halogenase